MAIETQTLKKKLYTVKEAAKVLNTTPTVVYKLINMGDLRCLMLPNYKIPDTELDDFIQRSLKNATDYSDILKQRKEQMT